MALHIVTFIEYMSDLSNVVNEKKLLQVRIFNSSAMTHRKYFKPVLCYMEGAWTETDFGKIQEPFESERHHISADNWYDLQVSLR